jgi:hypothetical protein
MHSQCPAGAPLGGAHVPRLLAGFPHAGHAIFCGGADISRFPKCARLQSCVTHVLGTHIVDGVRHIHCTDSRGDSGFVATLLTSGFCQGTAVV